MQRHALTDATLHSVGEPRPPQPSCPCFPPGPSRLQNFTQMKQQLDGALLPANDANWNTGARFWARYLRCAPLSSIRGASIRVVSSGVGWPPFALCRFMLSRAS